ncbi:WD repeat-containing protein 20-like Protein [Tribolium castaneum]|uniref:WD repeat-containing protein 20-like Protein n=2 Tax=Tribolium castaneum TaxID=7070 RepID=D6WT27_TRICA|nr:WD repeat-containing protein 20-like Protein [Tribolium castaneum]
MSSRILAPKMARADTLCSQSLLEAGDRPLERPLGGEPGDVKTQFVTREGTYRLMTLSEYSRPNRVGYQTQGQTPPQVRVSLVTLPDQGERICFNHGRELYVYVYKGIKKAADLSKPLEKKVYKGTNPTCHDFNIASASGESVSLLIGFSTGQIQLIDPIKKELNKLFNEERLIDKTRVTCLRWVPGSRSLFLAAHASGQLYVYNEELPCGSAAPHYQPFKVGEGFSVSTCKTKSTRNPLFRWLLGTGSAINELAFSPSGAQLAIVSQDGQLRVFQYDSMELLGTARSYFGGLLCVAWSGDGRLIAVGGEDDLVTVYSMEQKRVVGRAQGHRSWVAAVAFDWFLEAESCYRLGSVGHDTQLCLWELPEDALTTPSKPKVKRRSDPLQLVGTPACPRLDECPVLEPLVCKKIAHERLTALVFRPDCIITACQDGYVYTWARPPS